MAEDLQGANFSHTRFIFMGFPELYKHRRLLFFPFFIVYVDGKCTNCILLHLNETKMHKHSSVFSTGIQSMCVLFVTSSHQFKPYLMQSLVFSVLTSWCIAFLIRVLISVLIISVESTILLAMALDRFIAICIPLRYNEIMNSTVFLKLSIFTAVRSGSIMTSLVILAHSLSFCGSNIIKQCYCEHMALVSLSCGSTSRNETMGLIVIICFVGCDVSVIVFSYIMILKAVLRTASVEGRWKAFHTCGTHLIVMLFFYLTGSVTFLAHNLRIAIPTDAHTFLGIMYIVFPAGLNPIIYGVRTKEIRNVIVRLFRMRRKLVVPVNTN
uniref:Odorant receptor, family 55, subfamily E, member 1 n=1 Tax=Lepisosteus oculatus TaxID=7918 RepID=W5M3P8_LEPOC